MFACVYGAAFGAIQLTPQIVPGLVPDLRPLDRLEGSYEGAERTEAGGPEEKAEDAKEKA